ncbi:MAG TPA: hypothetical protein PLU58_00675 [Saprospiraceae bacterium]|nr:hypothetical protein [Saprospiraceae bacterium]
MAKKSPAIDLTANKYVIKGEYDGEYEIHDNMYVMDFDKGSVEKKEIYYHQKSYKGHIWVNGKELKPKQAAKLRPALASKDQDFCWGHKGAGAKIVALAICFEIFRYTEWAANIYQVFAEKYIYPLKRENFEIEIDITDFLIDNREKLTYDYYTRYYEFSGGSREIILKKNPSANKFSVNLLDEVAWSYVDRKEFSYNWKMPSVSAFFGIKEINHEPEKAPFDRQAAFKTIRRSLQREFFTRQYSHLEDTCEHLLASEIHYILSIFSYKRDERLQKRAVILRQRFKKDEGKFLTLMAKKQMRKNEK